MHPLTRVALLAAFFAAVQIGVRGEPFVPDEAEPIARPCSSMFNSAREQARDAKVDYDKTIKRAEKGDLRSLRTLLRLSMVMDAAGAGVHSYVLLELLKRYGDVRFAREVEMLPTNIRARVRALLCYPMGESQISGFPNTIRALSK